MTRPEARRSRYRSASTGDARCRYHQLPAPGVELGMDPTRSSARAIRSGSTTRGPTVSISRCQAVLPDPGDRVGCLHRPRVLGPHRVAACCISWLEQIGKIRAAHEFVATYGSPRAWLELRRQSVRVGRKRVSDSCAPTSWRAPTTPRCASVLARL